VFFAHFDVDAFYASVEVRDDPSLRGKPLAVAGSSRRAVVLTASYEARPFGVRSALPLYRALEACPHLTVVKPRMDVYKSVSREIFAVFAESGYPLEGLSMDEAFVELPFDALVQAEAFARGVRARVLERTALSVSAGVAAGKMIAKIASDTCKPNGLLCVEPGTEAAFLAPMPVGRLWGIGPKTRERVTRYGVETIGDVAALDAGALRELFGSWGEQVGELARGIDHRRVEPERETKSISSEETFEYDAVEEKSMIAMLREQTRDVVGKLEREALFAQTVGVKIRLRDFTTINRQTTLLEPTRDPQAIFRAAVHCLRRAEIDGRPVRLIGLRLASFSADSSSQISLFGGR
jgi:DNA polymerase-4